MKLTYKIIKTVRFISKHSLSCCPKARINGMINLNYYWNNRCLILEQKYIALIDCDSFFVSCERKLNPELKGIPVSVVSGERGCVIARSKEAKKLGIPMGIPLFQAIENYFS